MLDSTLSQSLCFQGWLLTGVTRTLQDYASVSIPLFSGLVTDQDKDVARPGMGVSIPLFSGLVTDRQKDVLAAEAASQSLCFQGWLLTATRV